MRLRLYVVRGDLDVEQKTVLRNGTQAMTGNLDMDDHFINNLPNPVHDQDAVTKTYADTKMSRSGGTMMGDIQMTDNRITGLSDPVNNQDAATKWYVDMNRSSSMDTRTTAIFKQPLLDIGEGRTKWAPQPKWAPARLPLFTMVRVMFHYWC